MIVGVPKEIKTAEHRVALVPAGVESLVGDGHSVLVEQGAGIGSGFADEAYRTAGGTLVPKAAEVWAKAEMVVKVKEPIEPEWPCMRKGQVVFTYFHFAASEPLTRAVIKSGPVAIAYATSPTCFPRASIWGTPIASTWWSGCAGPASSSAPCCCPAPRLRNWCGGTI